MNDVLKWNTKQTCKQSNCTLITLNNDKYRPDKANLRSCYITARHIVLEVVLTRCVIDYVPSSHEKNVSDRRKTSCDIADAKIAKCAIQIEMLKIPNVMRPQKARGPKKRRPRVFIAYSQESTEHKKRVLILANQLRNDGIDAEIDQYHVDPPEGWPLWCQRQIEMADYVPIICTESLYRGVCGAELPGKGLGVLWEARIIRQAIYDAGAVGGKFIPVLFSGADSKWIPVPIKGQTSHVLDSDQGYEALYRHLTGQPEVLRPKVGDLRTLPPRQPS